MAEAIKLKGARKAIADHMMQSLAGSAQLSFHTTCDVTELLLAREEWKAGNRTISLEDCVIAALARTMAKHRQFNGNTVADGFVAADTVDVSVAISVNGLLLTPIIRGADQLTLDQIADHRRDLVGRARTGQLKTSEMVGGTVTVSNLGRSCVRHFTPILNKGQPVILGIGRIDARVALAADGSIVQRQEIGLSLTVDHRFIDGEPAAQLLGGICDQLACIDSER